MKRIIYMLIGVLLCMSSCNTNDAPSRSENSIKLKFDENKQFKIAQFTDIHWMNTSPNCAATAEVIKHVLDTEKPHVAIITGDIVWKEGSIDGWNTIAKIFEDAQIPWAVVFGNHDSEGELSRDTIFDMLVGKPYFIGEKGTEMQGCGNYSLPVLSSDGTSVASVLYCIDSNDYPTDPKMGAYDWIHFDQIAWFRNEVASNTKNNNNIKQPSLAFFHIPLHEFGDIVGAPTTVGTKNEGIAHGALNSGFFSAMYEAGNIMGAFTGHDHDNDYIGILHDIALAFGRTSGYDAYGDLEKGARIILMYEGVHKFDTWIRTKKGTEQLYYYPIGISADEEQKMDYLSGKKYEVAPEQGIRYTYYESDSKMREVAHIYTKAKEVKSGELDNLSIVPAAVQDSFAFVYKGLINVPERGVYRFYTYSDDGSVLYIDGKIIVDNDGSHSAKRVDGKVALEAGYHDFEVRYFENYMGELLEVGWSSRNIHEELIPNDVLFRVKK